MNNTDCLKDLPKICLPHTSMFELPEVEPVTVKKMNLTRDLIDILVNYCKLCDIKNYEDVRQACRNCLSRYIFISNGNKYISVSNSKDLIDRYDFLVDQTSSELGILPEIVSPLFLKKIEENRKPNPVEFLYYTYLLFPNLDPNQFSHNMNVIKRSVNVLWDRLSGTKHSSLQSMLYLYSTEGGVGKSVFQNIIYEWSKQNDIKVTSTRVPHNQFVGDEFNKNGICILSDIRKDECENWCRNNDLIDGTNYVVEKKGKDRYELKCQSFLIGSSNFKPKDENNRRIDNSIVTFSSSKLEPITEHKAFKLKDNKVDIDYYVPIVDKWICSCPDIYFDYSKYPSELQSSAGDWYDEIEDNYSFVLRSMSNYCLNEKERLKSEEYCISTATFTNRLNKEVESDMIKDIETTYKFSRKQVHHILNHLDKKGKIVLTGNARGTYQRSYNIYNLVQDSEKIMNEKTKCGYNEFFDCEPEYIQEKMIVQDVSEKILKDQNYELSEECLQFLKNKDDYIDFNTLFSDEEPSDSLLKVS